MDAAGRHQDVPVPPDRWEQLVERLLESLARAHTEVRTLHERNAALEQEIVELKKQIPGSASSTKITEPFSMRAEEKRQEARGKKSKKRKRGRRGRISNEEKLQQANRTEDIYPKGVPEDQCQLSHVRLVWRVLEGRLAERVAYRIFRFKKQYGVIPRLARITG